ncbi:MAG: type Z 30S ribosomal protein S14 [Candidatus Dojkabacteria bacterium]|nr:MAG: type Z 30S ribosomal protein S14 [Candidatus Dojkabacteria bacterium]
MSKKIKEAKHTALVKKAKFQSRIFNQCSRCGRRRAYIRYFSLCRICLRELAHQGMLPGVTKSSW